MLELNPPKPTMIVGGLGAFGWPYLSNTASFVVCAVYSVKDHHKLLTYSSSLKNICARQVVLDKWLPRDMSFTRRGKGMKYASSKSNIDVKYVVFEQRP